MRNSKVIRTLVHLSEEEKGDHGWWRDRTTRGKYVMYIMFGYAIILVHGHGVSEFAKPSGVYLHVVLVNDSKKP